MIALLYIGLIVVAFFFLIVLPQRRRMAAHQAMVASLVVGDHVTTTGGIQGTISSLDDEVVRLEIADGVLIRLVRNAVAQKVAPEGQFGGERTDETTNG